MLTKRLLHTAAVLALGSAALTACSSAGGTSAAAPTASGAATATAVPTPSGSSGSSSGASDPTASAVASGGNSSGGSTSGGNSSGGSQGGTGSPVVARTAACRTADLSFGYGPDSGPQVVGDTTAPEVVKLTNTRSSACAMYGFPGVDLITNYGRISVPRSGQSPRRVVLQPGQSAVFDVIYPVNTDNGSGIRVTSMVITLPNETHSRTLAWGEGTLPVGAGASKGLVVDPVSPFPG
jgi:hypothetical protein